MSTAAAPTVTRPAAAPASSRERTGFRARVAALPRAAWACALVALVNAVVWAVTMPPLQGPDEPSHISYVEYVTHTGKLPSDVAPQTGENSELFSRIDTLLRREPFSAEGPHTWSPAQAAIAASIMSRERGIVGDHPLYLRDNPPLYYAIDTAVTNASGAHDERTRILVMRLVSAFIVAFGAFMAFMFVREVLPTSPRWVWTAGGLAYAFHPVVASMGGAVNPEGMLGAVGATLLYLVARVFRRGLSPGLGVAIGAVALTGMLTKSSAAGLLPGVALACVIALVRAWRRSGRTLSPRTRRTLIGMAGGAAVFVLGMAAWYWLQQHEFNRGVSTTTSGFTTLYPTATWHGQLDYIWQTYLPRLWFMPVPFQRAPHYPLWSVYVQGFVGRFGWHQYNFPVPASYAGLAFMLGLGALAVRAFRLIPGTFRRRLPEILSYLAMFAGLMLVIHYAGYRYRVVGGGPKGANFEQVRYILSMFGLWALLVAVAVRGLPQRWAKPGAAFIVGVLMVHSLAAELLTIQRFYL